VRISWAYFRHQFDLAKTRHTASMRRRVVILGKRDRYKLPAFAGVRIASSDRLNSSLVAAVVELVPALKLAVELELSSEAGCEHKHP
jgi:hypothetical protein